MYVAHKEPELVLAMFVVLEQPETAELHVLENHAQFVPTEHAGHALLFEPVDEPVWHWLRLLHQPHELLRLKEKRWLEHERGWEKYFH